MLHQAAFDLTQLTLPLVHSLPSLFVLFFYLPPEDSEIIKQWRKFSLLRSLIHSHSEIKDASGLNIYRQVVGFRVKHLTHYANSLHCHQYIFANMFGRSNISKTSARGSSGFQTLELFETTRPQAEWFYCFRAFGNLMKPKVRVFEITSPTKKISWNYHLNKVSQFNYYIWDMKCAWSYHLTAALWQFLNIHELMSCWYLAVCQSWANTLFQKANGRVQI